jgi:serine/threonine-protein kinase HipA
MERIAKVYMHELLAGILKEDEEGQFSFHYELDYLKNKSARPVSLTLPLREIPYISNMLFPFFDGLIPEGWLRKAAIVHWRIKHEDRMELLMLCCKETVGAVSIVPANKSAA